MGDIIATMLGLAGIIGAVWLAVIPVQILNEIKRQGAAREAEAVRITALLRVIARGEKPAAFPLPDETSEPLQALIDDRSCKFG